MVMVSNCRDVKVKIRMNEDQLEVVCSFKCSGAITHVQEEQRLDMFNELCSRRAMLALASAIVQV